MKKYLILTCIAVLFSCDSTEDEPVPEVTVAGCTDPQASNYQANATEEDCSCLYDGFTAVGSPPTNVEKNVFLEEFTGEWCGWCVDATVRVEQIIADNPGRVFAMAIHQGDFLQNSTSLDLLDKFSVQSFPSGIVDRRGDVIGRGLWAGRVELEMEKTANAQVAIETQLNGTTLEGVIHVDFTSDFGSQVYFVTLFVVENGIPAIAQQNYYNNRSGSENHPYFGRPAVLGQDEYTHNHVVRNKIRDYRIAEKAVSNQGVYTRKFSADLSQYYDIQNVEIIAIVTQGNGNNVLNVNSVAAGSTVNW